MGFLEVNHLFFNLTPFNLRTFISIIASCIHRWTDKFLKGVRKNVPLKYIYHYLEPLTRMYEFELRCMNFMTRRNGFYEPWNVSNWMNRKVATLLPTNFSCEGKSCHTWYITILQLLYTVAELFKFRILVKRSQYMQTGTLRVVVNTFLPIIADPFELSEPNALTPINSESICSKFNIHV